MSEVIVVGVDGSESAQAALRFALEEARMRGAAVREGAPARVLLARAVVARPCL